MNLVVGLVDAVAGGERLRRAKEAALPPARQQLRGGGADDAPRELHVLLARVVRADGESGTHSINHIWADVTTMDNLHIAKICN